MTTEATRRRAQRIEERIREAKGTVAVYYNPRVPNPANAWAYIPATSDRYAMMMERAAQHLVAVYNYKALREWIEADIDYMLAGAA